ncbi:MAG: conjugative transposon protein TraM, partial [Bacteroides sp.]
MKESNEVKTPQSDESKHAQKERMKKMLIYPLMVLICGVSIYFIFAPSEEEKAQEQDGFNTEIPMPKGSTMTDDKKSAYEQAGLEQKKKERNRSMQDLASMFGDDEE